VTVASAATVANAATVETAVAATGRMGDLRVRPRLRLPKLPAPRCRRRHPTCRVRQRVRLLRFCRR